MVAPQNLSEIVQTFRPLQELVPSHWQTGSIQAEDGTRIHYTRTGGEKPPVVLLHGVQVNGLTWLRTAQALETSYDVIMPDFRGHGESGGVENGLSTDILVSDMLTLVKTLDLEKPFVIGHSMGADIAGRVAAVYPLRGVVLVDPALQNFAAALMTSDEPPAWMQALFAKMNALKTQSHPERMVSGLGLLMPGTLLWHEADYVSFVEGQAQFDLGFYHYMANLNYLFEAPKVIAQIACPILLLTARPMMPNATIELGAFKDKCEHVHFEQSGHAIMFEQFDAFIKVVEQFFSRRCGDSLA